MNRFKEELGKIRGMSFKEAFDHIITYYGLVIAALIFALIFIISLTSSVIKNKLTVPVISVGIQNEIAFSYESDITDLLKDTFPDSAGYHKPVTCSFSGAGDTNDVYAGIQLAAYLAAGDLNAIICDRETVNYIGASDSGAVITDISGTVLGEKAAAAGISPLYYVRYENWDNQEAAKHLLDRIQSQK